MPITPTPEQDQSLALFATGENLAIEAGAGAGKTSTLVLLAEQAKAQGRKGLYLAFNKALVVEAGGKLPNNVTASTAHSLAYRAYGYRFKARLGSSARQKSADLARTLGIRSLTVAYGSTTKTLSAGYLAGLTLRGIENFCASADPAPTARHLPYVDGIDLPHEGAKTYGSNNVVREFLADALVAAWADLSDLHGTLPYKHSHYLKAYQLSNPVIGVDFILFDEAQDVSPVLLAIVGRQACQQVYVGDSAQAIYEFTGAIDALSKIIATGAATATLSQSFRFGPEVANVANGLLRRIGSKLNLRGSGPAGVVAPVDEPDAILTRTNAESVRRCIAAKAQGRKPYLVGEGKEVIAFARASIDLVAKGWTPHPELTCFGTWDEVREYVATDEQGGDLRLLVALVDEFGASTIIEALSGLGREADADVVISTAHKAKGREWDTVTIAGDFPKPKEGSSDVATSELRLCYVACTRARRELDITALAHVDEQGACPPPAGDAS